MLNVIKTEKIHGLRRKALGLNLNGEDLPVQKSPQYLIVRENDEGFIVSSFNLDVNNKIKLLTANDFPEIVELNLFWDYFDNFRLYVDIQFFKKGISTSNKNIFDAHLKFRIYADFHNWKRKYSFTDYKERFYKSLPEFSEDINFPFFPLEDEEDAKSLDVEFSIFHKFSDAPISSEIKKYEEAILQCHRKAITELEKEISEDLVVALFNFPDNLKIPCKQYLLYFVQFLKDLGIDATSNLQEEAGKVLFSVTPTDDIEALDKIREALAIYLNLPSSPIVYDDSFAAMKLQQQIENLLHSQKMATRELQFNEKLLVAQSEIIHEKNVTISQLQSNNEQLIKTVEKISSPTIMMDSVENKEELEELYDGVKVGESETLKKWLGISLNPAKAIKTAVKNTIGKGDENKSILGLDDKSESGK